MPVTINGNNTPTAGGVVYGDGSTYASTTAGSAGSVLYSAGASAPAFTAVGTAGQVLQSNGAAAPSWVTAGGGSPATPTVEGLVYGKMTASGASPRLTALGYNAGVATTGVNNVFIGVSAGQANVAGTDSIAIGYQAMQNYTGADGLNIAIGSNALTTATSGTSYLNIAIGPDAMKLNTSGYGNIAMGYRSLENNTSGRFSTAIGYNALRYLISGNDGSTAVGTDSLTAVTTGVYNVGCGGSTGSTITTGSYNTLMGYGALGAASNTTSSSNTAIGYNSMATAGSRNNCTAVGRDSLYQLTTGQHNIGIGVNAGEALTTGSSNIYIGSGTVYASSASVNNELIIAAYTLQSGKGSQTAYIFANSGAGAGGSYYNGANTTTWNTTSDQRIKKNIVDNNVGLEKITQIQVRNFEYRLPEEIDSELKASDAIIKSGVQLGVIAQELQQVLPECVKQETTGVYSVDSDNLTWYMINAIKELKAEIDKLKGNV